MFAHEIAAHESEIARNVAERIDYATFVMRYQSAVAFSLKYKPSEVGHMTGVLRMSALADAYPEYMDRYDAHY